MRTNTIMLAAAAIAAAGLWMENAMAAPTTWVYTSIGDRPIISNDDVYVPLFVPGEPALAPAMPGLFYDQYGIRMGVSVPGPLVAAIFGNDYYSHVATVRSPSLYVPGGLRLEGITIDSDADWAAPFRASNGYVQPAFIEQGGPVGDFDLSTFAFNTIASGGDYAYVGYADATRTRFGYLQMERASATDITQWRLVGFAYGEVGEAIEVVDLTVVPPAPSAALLALGFVGLKRRRRATSHAECLVSSASMV
jgi:hypothetical protein